MEWYKIWDFIKTYWWVPFVIAFNLLVIGVLIWGAYSCARDVENHGIKGEVEKLWYGKEKP